MQPRPEYPRPQFVRQQWVNLNGEWDFDFDDERRGETEGWQFGNRGFSRKITVPFTFESKLSGIGETEFHDVVWYRKAFTTSADFAGKRILLHFGAVDYAAKVWVNGKLAVTHEGGHTPFQAEITSLLQEGDNLIVVRAEDFGTDVTLPRGKQYWKEQSEVIWYTRTTGIWQTVWLEAVPDTYIEEIRFTPDIDKNDIEIRTTCNHWTSNSKLQLEVKISFEGETIKEDVYSVRSAQETRTIHLEDFNDHSMGRWWSPEKPNLYDVEFALLSNGQRIDEVKSYFGMRKISIDDGKLCLNNRPYQMRLVLDQGYFPEGNLTAPSDEDLKKDIELTKEMGFNGARKHQKQEDPRWLYWCDRLGLLVWSEAANAYDYSDRYVERFTAEWIASMKRDYSHPSIVAWVPLNESWGVPAIKVNAFQQQHALAMYHLTKSLDATRPVISNDGWEHMTTDLLTIHDYEWRREVLTDRYSTTDKAISATPANRELLVGGTEYKNQPILVTEFGGIGYKKSEWEGWGYSGASDDEDFLARLDAVIQPMLDSPIVQGYCYTQLTDVEQEINGLLTYDRTPKVPLERIREIVTGVKKG